MYACPAHARYENFYRISAADPERLRSDRQTVSVIKTRRYPLRDYNDSIIRDKPLSYWPGNKAITSDTADVFTVRLFFIIIIILIGHRDSTFFFFYERSSEIRSALAYAGGSSYPIVRRELCRSYRVAYLQNAVQPPPSLESSSRTASSVPDRVLCALTSGFRAYLTIFLFRV